MFYSIYIRFENKMNTPKITPIQLKEFTCNQSHYGDIVPKLPMRSMLVAPSGAGKQCF